MRSNCCANIRIYLFLVFSSCSFHPFVVLISTWLQWSSISWFMTGSIQITEIRAWHVVVAFLWTCLSINMREKKNYKECWRCEIIQILALCIIITDKSFYKNCKVFFRVLPRSVTSCIVSRVFKTFPDCKYNL